MKRLMLLGGLRYLIPLIEEAHRMGVHVITADYLPDNIAHRYSDEYCNVNIVDKEAVLEAGRRLKIDGILSHAVDPGVTTAAYVAEKLGLPFQCSYESACILQDKGRFRKFLAENGFNCPTAKSYSDADNAVADASIFHWPVIVKPVDSAGSKGVTKVETPEDLPAAIATALSSSISKKFIIEDFLDKVGPQNSGDIFLDNGQLAYLALSDQYFDSNAENPYTPAMNIWPSMMDSEYYADLFNQLQRLANLLNLNTGIYNVEARICSDGKVYIMEVSPRGGGNRLAEIQDMGSGQTMNKAELEKALGLPVTKIHQPIFDGIWCNHVLHSTHEGILESVDIDPAFREKYVKDIGLTVSPGDKILPFTGANTSLGTIFLRTDTREEMDKILTDIDKFIKIIIAQPPLT